MFGALNSGSSSPGSSRTDFRTSISSGWGEVEGVERVIYSWSLFATPIRHKFLTEGSLGPNTDFTF